MVDPDGDMAGAHRAVEDNEAGLVDLAEPENIQVGSPDILAEDRRIHVAGIQAAGIPVVDSPEASVLDMRTEGSRMWCCENKPQEHGVQSRCWDRWTNLRRRASGAAQPGAASHPAP